MYSNSLRYTSQCTWYCVYVQYEKVITDSHSSKITVIQHVDAPTWQF